ncbi:nucleoporin NUP188 isoform X2 [Ixodes scapularis]|uniref:nucleoporin NUP188 isoform X2 n=1 Tax=Ixodes scapularis TaxID=6945 RepID=UPI001C381DB8|nr:nucleoporin NUP188 isoform X2 [Ixodes scapularis]
MADIQRSIKDLWVIISGNTVLKSNELVGTELTKNADQVLNGILYFTEKRKDPCRAPNDFHPELLTKLSTLLGLDKDRSYELFCSYLVYEYRGTHDDLKVTLSSERNIPYILHEVWNFYRTERLFSLFCLKHILENWQNKAHPYMELFDGFLESINANEVVIKKVIEQLEVVIELQAPARDTHGPYMTNALIAQWVNYTLQEQCELLQIALLYYKEMQPKLDDIIQLLKIFQKHSFGQRHPYRHLLNEAHGSMLDLIRTDHQLLKDNKEKLEALDRSMSCLGVQGVHGPLLLAWLLVRSWALPNVPPGNLGQVALRSNAFGYLHNALSHPAFVGNGVVPTKVHAIVYELVLLLVSSFEHHTLGPIGPLYSLAEKLLAYPALAEDFWREGEATGLGHLFAEAKRAFPLNAEPLLEMTASLARAGEASAQKVIHYLQDLPCFVESLDHIDPQEMNTMSDGSTVQLKTNHFPYGTGSVILPRGTEGQLLVSEGVSMIQWHVGVNGWQICLCEMAKPRDMDQAWLRRVLHITRLVRSLLESDPSLHDLLAHLVDALFAMLERVTTLSHPPLELLGECLRVAAVLAKQNPRAIWGHLVQTGILPTLSTKPKSAAQLAKGYLVTDSMLSQAMASQERVVGNHPVCLAFLSLLASVSETFVETVDEDFLACLVVVLRDLFPSFHQWPYATARDRDVVGHRCLVIFHRVLTLSPAFRASTVGSCEVCVYSLLHGDAGQALLRLIIAGEASVARAIELEGSQQSEDLLTSVRLCFSLLNRLLLLSTGSGAGASSPLEQRLLVSPNQSSAACLVTSVGHFLYLRFDPRLCTLAIQLLKRIAKLYPMSLLACLGRDAEGFRDQALLRLGKLTEDVRLKVAILQLLNVCIRTQPGLSQLFLSSPDSSGGSGGSGSNDNNAQKTAELSPCLGEVLKILKMKREGVYFCPTELHCSAMEVVHTLWACHQLRAMEVLRNDKTFWELVCFPVLSNSVLTQDPRLVAFILRTLALELFHSKSQLDPNVKSIFERVQKNGFIKKWSKLVNSSLPHLSDMNASITLMDASDMSNSVTDSVALLSGWRDLCVTLAKCQHVQLTASEKHSILQDILQGLMADEALENFKINILLGELYLVLLNQWSSASDTTTPSWCSNIDKLLSMLAPGVTSVHPRLVLTVATLLASAVGILRLKMDAGDKDLQPFHLDSWTQSLCVLLKYYSQQCIDDLKTTHLLSVRVCTSLVILLKDVLGLSKEKGSCCPLLQQHLIVSTLCRVLHACLQVRKGNHLAHAICHLFLSLASTPQMAEALQLCGVLEKASPYLGACYGGGDRSWLEVYRLLVQLATVMLHTLRHFFIEDAHAFMVLHLDRLISCLMQVRTSPANVHEALVTCHLAYIMASLRTSWPCDQMNPLTTLMRGVCSAASAAISYLCRPTLLQHLIEYKKGSPAQLRCEEETNQPRRQLSTEDVCDPSPKLTEARSKLLELLSVCLACCQQFSPSVAEAVSDQSLDVDQWPPIVEVSFSSPSLEQEHHLTFGTLFQVSHLCLKFLTKSERLTKSPGASPGVLHPERSLVLTVLEMSLSLVLGQAILCRLQPHVPPREKQLLSRELSAEISSVKMQVQRHLRRGGPVSPSASRTGGPQIPPDPLSEWGLVQVFIQIVDQVFK